MKKLLIILSSFLLSNTPFAQGLSQFSDIKIVEEDYGYELESYNAKDDNFSLEVSFGAITNMSEFSSTNTISGTLTFYSSDLSYTLYGALNTLDVAAVTSFDNIDASLNTYSIGAGLSRRSILINDFININSIYDEIQTNITYNLADSEAFGVDLAGLGFNAGYGLIWRASGGVHFSLRFIYNLMALKSSDDTTPVETTASWVSAQAGLGFIF
ncbi:MULTISPECIES: hypothetical protein [Halobacteriovorax]|uniref:Outer membrane protein beta-barrel domain-containing protein n=1 Tax=Halobacteriovorax vibrionivorans TaxID=2152716 RepID=A0ABY0II06_9BACT|nr:MULTISPECIES: hypothetical protein [Halobacteriovorax]RZF22242.1 hypothetical protein DAY19_00300 [Halobacteriovorax vibrionivorans]TGD48494.1 hypothetical protein EP118_03215 [Halobacteriovorax sp. Y22]